MTDWLLHNAGWKLFSLAVAVFLWVTYASDPELGAFVSVPVEYKGMPEDMEISSEVTAYVSLDVRGTAERVRRFSAAPSPVVLDFSNISKPGEQSFHLDGRNVDLPNGIRLVRAIPAQLRFQFEQRTTREVPVQVRFSGSPPVGYEVARYEVRPETLAIAGPDSRAKRIDFAVTDPVDLSNVVGVSEFRVNAFVGDPQVRFQQPEQKVQVKVFMEKK